MNSDIERALFNLLSGHFDAEEILRGERIQSLWSGYGEIVRYRIDGMAVVVKVVDPVGQGHHPRGWNTSLSHQRKLDSYHNEQTFYANYTHLTDSFCRVPKFIASGKQDDMRWLVMEDLDEQGFTYRCDDAPPTLIDKGIRWLAYFHALFLQHKTPDLWQVGTYWHLATRPDEYRNMTDGVLKQQARAIDHKLNQARHRTLVHGDAKLANFCFSADLEDLAAVDFQYVGRGVGIKDLVYFLGSCMNENELFTQAQHNVDQYFRYLEQALTHYNLECEFASLEQEWRNLVPFAWADFERFLMGWASEHHKLNRYSQQQTQVALQQIS
ncbi:phosphotransferase [Aliiglaciecola litoralis]|uniref:DUF1679 domain-containing protein n=1 Tax=Aliiglaciecola litoralis TaxID=582857 RepID=A0ABP3WT21_9ALTE